MAEKEINPVPIYRLFEHLPDKSCKFIGYFTAKQAASYASQAYVAIGFNDDDWVTNGGTYDISIGWSLQAEEMSEKRYDCVPVIRRILLEEPEFNYIEYCSKPPFYAYISAGLNDDGADKIHGIVTIFDRIAIKIRIAERERTSGTMYLPIGNDVLELAYFHDHVINHPEDDTRTVENGPKSIGFDVSDENNMSKLRQIVKYANILSHAKIKGLWLDISGSEI